MWVDIPVPWILWVGDASSDVGLLEGVLSLNLTASLPLGNVLWLNSTYFQRLSLLFLKMKYRRQMSHQKNPPTFHCTGW